VGGFVKGFFEVVGSLGELLAFGDNVTVVLNLLIGFICIGFERAAGIFFFFAWWTGYALFLVMLWFYVSISPIEYAVVL
jgi:hypothetical protein